MPLPVLHVVRSLWPRWIPTGVVGRDGERGRGVVGLVTGC